MTLQWYGITVKSRSTPREFDVNRERIPAAAHKTARFVPTRSERSRAQRL